MEQLLAILRENSLAAVAAGVVIGLYVVGRIDDEDEDHLPKYVTIDDQISYHEKRMKHLQAIREQNLSKDETLAELVQMVERLQKEIEGLKHEH